MSFISIYIVLSALILVTSLVVCGFMYFSYTSITRDVADEDTYILIDSDDSVVSSICKEILHESRWAKTLRKSSETSTTSHENIKPHNENVVHKEGQLEIHLRDVDIVPTNFRPAAVSRSQTETRNSSWSTKSESLKLTPILEVLPPESPSFN